VVYGAGEGYAFAPTAIPLLRPQKIK